MKTIATTIAAAIAAFLIGLSFALSPKPDARESALVARCNELSQKNDAQAQTITSLEFAVKNLQAECMTYAGERDDLQTKADSLTVQLAESQKARQRPEALPVGEPACAEVPRRSAAVPSAVPVYQRRGILGRLRNR